MRICELGDGDGRPADGEEQQRQQEEEAPVSGEVVRVRAKRALVGAGARVLFYPTLLYNVLRNQFEAEFRWWDRVDQVGGLPAFTRIPSVINFSS
jgi:atypical dual specificity phosphatase